MKRKQIVSLLLLSVVMVAIPITVFFIRQQQELRGRAAPSTTISLSSSNPSPEVGETFTISLNIDTGTNSVIGIQPYISYDPSKVRPRNAADVTKGSFFTDPTTILSGININNTNGVVTFIEYLPLPGGVPQQGTGVIATVVFEAVGAGAATIALTDQSLVTASQEGVNVLQTKNPTTVTVVNAQGGLTPTPTTTPTGTPTGPTATPTPTPTGTSGGQPTATPTSVSSQVTLQAQSGSTGSTTPTPSQLPQAGFSLPLIGITTIGFLLLTVGLLVAL